MSEATPKLSIAFSYKVDGVRYYLVNQPCGDEPVLIGVGGESSTRDARFEDALNWAYAVGRRDGIREQEGHRSHWLQAMRTLAPGEAMAKAAAVECPYDRCHGVGWVHHEKVCHGKDAVCAFCEGEDAGI